MKGLLGECGCCQASGPHTLSGRMVRDMGTSLPLRAPYTITGPCESPGSQPFMPRCQEIVSHIHQAACPPRPTQLQTGSSHRHNPLQGPPQETCLHPPGRLQQPSPEVIHGGSSSPKAPGSHGRPFRCYFPLIFQVLGLQSVIKIIRICHEFSKSPCVHHH